MIRINKRKLVISLVTLGVTASLVTTTCLTFFPIIKEKEKYGVENYYIKSNQDVIDFFKNKNDENSISGNNIEGKVNINIDSYQQSNKLSYSTPEVKINYKFYNVGLVSWKNNLDSIKEPNDFIKWLNANIFNSWEYNVSSWWAKAGKRFMGVNVVMPHWAPEVKTNHSSKTYKRWESKIEKKVVKFIVDEIYKYISMFYVSPNIKEQMDKYLYPIAKYLAYDFSLKPVIKELEVNDNLKITYLDFGKIKAKMIFPKSIIFQANHILPIVDYRTDTKCTGPKCSHNIRHLGDVIITAIKDLVGWAFGSSHSYLSDIVSISISAVLFKYLENLSNSGSISQEVYEHLKLLISYVTGSRFLQRASNFINENLSDVLFEYTGRVEKHGIQLGKCGHLVSGIKINRNENNIKTTTDKPFILFEIKTDSIFSRKNQFDLNSIQCIVEMANYKKLYEYLETKDIDPKVRNILYSNIINTSTSSQDIYDTYIKYTNNITYPTEYKNRLNYFNEFLSLGWKLPKDIMLWDVPYEYILPSYLSETFSEYSNNKNEIFYSNFNFINELDTNLITGKNIFAKRFERSIYTYLG